MKLFMLTTVLVAIAGLSFQAEANPKCHPNNCYMDYVSPVCTPGQPCSDIAYPVEVCPWDCGKPVPANCQERCKPCKTAICSDICVCEKVCPTEGKPNLA